MKTSSLVALLVLPSFAIIALANCTPSEAKTARNVAIKLTDDACHEVQDAGVVPPGEEEFVNLLCTGLDIADKVKILLPRKEWHAIRARKSAVDAGPGK